MLHGYEETLHEEELAGRIRALEKASPDDLRDQGWSVALHLDYRQDKKDIRYWLLTKNGRAVIGEGATDAEALEKVRDQVRRLYRPEDPR